MMSRSTVWTIAFGLMALTVLSWSALQGQPPQVRPMIFQQPGRFQVVFVAPERNQAGQPDSYVIFDTQTGELYKADDTDVKAYRDLPKGPRPLLKEPDLPRDKDGKIKLEFKDGEIEKILKESKK